MLVLSAYTSCRVPSRHSIIPVPSNLSNSEVRVPKKEEQKKRFKCATPYLYLITSENDPVYLVYRVPAIGGTFKKGGAS